MLHILETMSILISLNKKNISRLNFYLFHYLILFSLVSISFQFHLAAAVNGILAGASTMRPLPPPPHTHTHLAREYFDVLRGELFHESCLTTGKHCKQKLFVKFYYCGTSITVCLNASHLSYIAACFFKAVCV